MPRSRNKLADWTQYVLARLAGFALSVGDIHSNLRLMETVGRLGYWINKRRRERVLANLRWSFPELDESGITRIARQSFEHFLKLVVELAVTPRVMHADTWARHVQFRDMGEGLKWFNAGKSAIVLTGHVGNWEMLGYTNALMGYPVDAIARPIDNPLVNRWVLDVRELRGLRIITKFDATDRMVQILGQGGQLGFVADQNAGKKGLFVPFFNRMASTYKSIGLLAISQQVPILCGFARRIGPSFHYEISTVDIIEPHHWQSQADPLFYVTARYTKAIETMVRRDPTQYLWMHRRWKSRPRWEQNGKPMPASVQAKIESLPWMDSATLERLKQPATD